MSEQEQRFNEFCESTKKTVLDLIEKQLARIWKFVMWFSGISFAIIISLVFAIAGLHVSDKYQQEQLDKINQNYLPLEIMNAIMDNNDKFIEVINAIPENKRSDARYMEALKSRNEFQRNVLLKISLTHRSAQTGSK